MKITGLDQLSRQLDEAQQVAVALDGDLGQVSFDPIDPASIEGAVARSNQSWMRVVFHGATVQRDGLLEPQRHRDRVALVLAGTWTPV